MFLRFATATAVLTALAIPAAAEPTDKEKRIRQMTEVMFKNYPPRALAAGEQGAVFFTVKLDAKAHPTSCDVTHSSGHPALDAETCALIVRHGVFKSVIGPNGKLKRSTHEGVVNWTIPGAAPVGIKAIPVTAATKPAAQVCRRYAKTGSNTATERVCMTQREWDLTNSRAREFWDELQGRKGAATTAGN